MLRNDALNGQHWDIYFYDEASGRLQSVVDMWTGEVNEFVWNPEGTLARWWNTEPNSYARVFGYDEEGRLTKIERDYGNGNLQTAYEYGYNADGVRVWKRDVLNQQEYRYLCSASCIGVLRAYKRYRDEAYLLMEMYVGTLSSVIYYREERLFVELRWLTGHEVFEAITPVRFLMIYKDRFGSQVNSYSVAEPMKPIPPEYLESCPPPDSPPPIIFPFPVPVSPPGDFKVPMGTSDEPRCSRDKPIVPKTDPAYECYRKACERWWKREEQISHYEMTVCATVAVCAAMNWSLPPADKNSRPDLYEKCYQPGGAEGIWGYTAIFGCCVECSIRVCFWLTQPERDANEARLRYEWRRCTRKYHNR